MNLAKTKSKLQLGLLIFLFCSTGVLGYLFYDSYRTNIQNRELIADNKIENKDLSQDLAIMKDKHETLEKEVDLLKSKVKKVTYKKKYTKKKKLRSAGKKYKKGKVNYKKLYYNLKKKCSKKSYKKSSSKKKYSKKKYSTKNSSYSKGIL